MCGVGYLYVCVWVNLVSQCRKNSAHGNKKDGHLYSCVSHCVKSNS